MSGGAGRADCVLPRRVIEKANRYPRGIWRGIQKCPPGVGDGDPVREREERSKGRGKRKQEVDWISPRPLCISLSPSSVYTRGCLHAVWRRRGRVKGVSVLAKYEHIDGKGRNSRARICVCVCILESSRRHTYAGHFRCDGVINGNWIEPPSTPSQGYRPVEIYRAEIQSSRHGS